VYQESSWGSGWPALQAENLNVICQPTALEIWEPRSLTTLRTLKYTEARTNIENEQKKDEKEA
jgi:hypothetical protein